MTPTAPDCRTQILANAKWFLEHFQANKNTFVYSEGPNRLTFEHWTKPQFPITTDCSGFVALCYLSAGADDPLGEHYNFCGYTGTELAADLHIPANQVVPGDLVVYGPGTGWHTAIVVQVQGNDILTISHGGPSGESPCYTWVNAPIHLPRKGYAIDGRQPQTFLRAHTGQVRTPWVLG